MKRKILLTVLSLTAIFLGAPCIGLALATPSTTVSGQITVVGSPTRIEAAGESGNLFMDIQGSGVFTGDIEGTFTAGAAWVFHKIGTPDMRANAHIVNYVSATVMGKTGTLTFMLYANTGKMINNWVIYGGTGELANLHGQGTYYAVTPGGDTLAYEGQIHFDP